MKRVAGRILCQKGIFSRANKLPLNQLIYRDATLIGEVISGDRQQIHIKAERKKVHSEE